MRRLLLATLGATLALAVPAAARDLYLRPATTSMQQPGWFASPFGLTPSERTRAKCFAWRASRGSTSLS